MVTPKRKINFLRRGNLEGYSRSITLWKLFHDNLPYSNSNKLSTDLHGICLQSLLFFRSYQFCSKIQNDCITSAAGVSAIILALHTRYSLYVTNTVFIDFNVLLLILIFCYKNQLIDISPKSQRTYGVKMLWLLYLPFHYRYIISKTVYNWYRWDVSIYFNYL